jgi:hypothetical protein
MKSRVRLIDKSPIYLELYDALSHYLGRQSLVVAAVIEQGVEPADLVKGIGGWRGKTVQIGQWGSEWHFFFHGGGCRLTHQRTKEPIDWNGPDPNSIDPFFFITHLDWRLEQGHELPLLRQIADRNNPLKVFNLIKELVEDGIVTPDYRLADLTPRASAA